jgi:hypothetical protein
MYARSVFWAATVGLLGSAAPAFPQSTEPQHQHPAPAAEAPRWHLMQDGVVYGLFNHQGGPRGGDEFVLPNWWMGMWIRQSGRNQFGINAMLSLDPGTVGSQGYREIFQVGETYEGKPLIDYQHPHDFLMQVSGAWRRSWSRTDLIVTGAIAGEPTLGPVAFMHRPSAAGLPLAPLGHHTFDSTHISFGVITAGLERGPWTFEGSVFNGREPDEERWNVDFGALDSYAARVWFKPDAAWAFQVSSGKLREPEELVPGDAVRTTASGSWFRRDADGFSAITVGYGVNSAHGDERHGVFGEFTIEKGANAFSGRVEHQQVETETLISGEVPHDDHHDPAEPSAVTALTLGGARRLLTWKGFEGAIGAQATFYHVPDVLRPTHGTHPVSYQIFFRLRLPAGNMGRMWNMVMSQGHKLSAGDHAGHQMR